MAATAVEFKQSFSPRNCLLSRAARFIAARRPYQAGHKEQANNSEPCRKHRFPGLVAGGEVARLPASSHGIPACLSILLRTQGVPQSVCGWSGSHAVRMTSRFPFVLDFAVSLLSSRSRGLPMKKHSHPLKPHQHPRYDARIKVLEKRFKKLEGQIQKNRTYFEYAFTLTAR